MSKWVRERQMVRKWGRRMQAGGEGGMSEGGHSGEHGGGSLQDCTGSTKTWNRPCFWLMVIANVVLHELCQQVLLG